MSLRWNHVVSNAGSLACTALVAVLIPATSAAKPRASTLRQGTFVAEEYAPFDRAGTGAIAGMGIAAPERGARMTIASRSVVLMPVTTWSRRWWDRWVLGGNALGEADPRPVAYIRQVIADSSGQFRFDWLPAGEYYVQSSVLRWSGRSGQPGAAMTLVVLGKQVALGEGQHTAVVLDSLRIDSEWFSPAWELGPGEMNDRPHSTLP